MTASHPSLARGLAAGVVVAACLPALALLLVPAPVPPPPPPPPLLDVADRHAVATALDDIDAAVARAASEHGTLSKRLEELERAERARFLGRAIARARDVRKAAGRPAAELAGPFPVDDLGDLGPLGLGASVRWLLTRDGEVVAPPGVTSPGGLATPGRDEDALVVDAVLAGAKRTLVRRCVVGEAHCLVDVLPLVAVPSSTTTRLRGVLAPVLAPPQPPPVAPPPRGLPWSAGYVVAGAGVALAIALARRLAGVGSAVRVAALRLRAGLAGAPAPASSTSPVLGAELAELDDAIAEVHRAMARSADAAVVADARRTRLALVVDALHASRGQGGVARVPVADAVDDPAVARVVVATNALLEALDARATRLGARVADLGEAAAHGSWPAALAALRVEVARITPDAPTPLDTVAALRSLAPDEIARHVAAGRAEADATAHAADARGAGAAPGTESDATSARPTP